MSEKPNYFKMLVRFPDGEWNELVLGCLFGIVFLFLVGPLFGGTFLAFFIAVAILLLIFGLVASLVITAVDYQMKFDSYLRETKPEIFAEAKPDADFNDGLNWEKGKEEEVAMFSSAPQCCPSCGEESGWNAVDQSNKGFSVGKAAAGAVLLGPVGLLGGALGKKLLLTIAGIVDSATTIRRNRLDQYSRGIGYVLQSLRERSGRRLFVLSLLWKSVRCRE